MSVVIRRFAAVVACLPISLLAVVVPATAARADSASGPVVIRSSHNDLSAPLTTLAPPAEDHQQKKVKPHRALPGHDHGSSPASVSSPTVPSSIPSTALNFDGVGQGFSGPNGTFTVNSAPPDTNGATGPNHYVQIVNSDLAVFNKSGAAVYGPVPINTLWSGFGGLCQTDNDGDPTAVYDVLANRFVISQFAITGANGTSTPFLQCVAVSQTGDPTGAYFRYSFPYSWFNDYPKMGVWPDGYYVTSNKFNAAGTAFLGAAVAAMDRGSMLSGLPATQQVFSTSTTYGGLLPSTLDGSTAPPAGAPNHLVALGSTSSTIAYWNDHLDWATPANSTFSGPTELSVTPYTEACNGGTCIPQSGTNQQLDSLADRVMNRLPYRNFGDHQALVVNHSVSAGSSVGVRWYELRVDASNSLSVFQQGTYAPDASFRWMGSIAMDHSGDMALGYSVASSSLHPQIRYTGRLASDPAGQMAQGESTIIAGAGSQTGNNLSRWGDYSAMTVDPADDCTFWYTTEYIPSNGSFNWKTRVGTLKFPNCSTAPANDFSISANPSSVSAQTGSSGTSTISTAVVSGTAETVGLSASGVPSGTTATFNPTSVTAGSSSTLTFAVGSSTAAGTYTITVTGTAPSATHSTTVSLTVTQPSDFSISANPSSLSVQTGSSGTSTISTAVVSGSAETINLSASGAPTGTTATLNPTSVTAGGSSTLALAVGSSTTPGTYTITVTGNAPSATHTTTVSLTVTTPPANDFSISASPTSVSVQAGSSGTSTISTAVVSGSAETISLSANGAPSGTTVTLSPTSVTAGGSSTLTLAVGSSTAPGTYTITVTGNAPSAAHSTTVSLTVSQPNNFSISANPSSVTVQTGSSGTSTISTAVVSGSAETINLSGSGAPSGTTATLSPTSVAAGGSSTLTLAVGSSTAAGSYTITVTGTAPSVTHTTSVTLTVTVPASGGITNGGFEAGTLAGWTSAGTTAAVSGGHSGSYSARVGGTSPTNGDSSIAQTFTAPSAGGGLSFWYKVACPDTLTYDWATASLRDNTAGTTVTMLAKTCSNSGAWVQSSSATLAASHSYTVTLVSHDDNYPSDPTYTFFDDVVIGAAPPPPPSGITNGGFETGNLNGWTSAGTTAAVSGGHSGSYSARVGGTSPTNGDSSIAQAFTAPTGTSTLSFWYKVACPDTLTYDWATATLVDNTAGTTRTVLAKTCSNNGTWVQVTASVTAGHAYKLILVSHDDNYPSDPTYTFYDDVALS